MERNWEIFDKREFLEKNLLEKFLKLKIFSRLYGISKTTSVGVYCHWAFFVCVQVGWLLYFVVKMSSLSRLLAGRKKDSPVWNYFIFSHETENQNAMNTVRCYP